MNRRQAKKKGLFKESRIDKISYQDFMKLPRKKRKKEIERELRKVKKELEKFKSSKKKSFHSEKIRQYLESGNLNEKRLVQELQFYERGATKTVKGADEHFNNVFKGLVEGDNKFGYDKNGKRRKVDKKLLRDFLESERFSILSLYGDSTQIMDAFFNAVDKGFSKEEIYAKFNDFINDKITFDIVEEFFEDGKKFK